MRQLRLRLVECRLKGARVDEEQFLPLLNVLARSEFDFLNGASHARLDGDAVDRLHRADGAYQVGNILPGSGCRSDGHCRVSGVGRAVCATDLATAEKSYRNDH
jgi:hypothetical protein